MKSSSILASVCLGLASAELIPFAFTDLEKSTTQKVVIFHDPAVEASVDKVAILKAIDDGAKYGTEYEYTVCDVTSDENKEPIKGAGFKEFPQVFTQTVEGGIEQYNGDFNEESFASFHEFRKMEVGEDKVVRMKDTDGKGDVDGAAGLMALQAEKPVLVKMYEEWCGHCKKMKKHFQYVSNLDGAKINNAVMLEVECSKVGGTFCNDMGTTGFPTVGFMFEGKYQKYTGGRTHAAMTEFLGDKTKWEMGDLPEKLAALAPSGGNDEL